MGAADAILAGLLLSIRLEQDRLAEARPTLEQALAESRLPVLRDALLFVLAHTGRYEEACAELAAAEPTRTLPDDGLLTGRLAFRAYACYDLARAGRAVPGQDLADLRNRLLPAAGQVVMHGGGIGVWGAADLFLGMALLLGGNHDEAGRALRQAVAVNDRAGNPAWGARARRLIARTLQDADRGSTPPERDGSWWTGAADAAVAAAGMPATAGQL